MTEKIDQHLLPRVYLQAFVSRDRPAEHPPEAPYHPPIWLIPKRLDAEGRARAPRNAFTSNRFYNLRDDDPRDPAIEAILGRIESAYAGLLKPLEARAELDAEQYGKLLIFIGSLRSRQPSQLAHWQRQFGELERVHRNVERAHTGKEEGADRIFWMKDEMSRRLMFQQAESYAEVVASAGWFLVNEAGVPLLTSDQPVIHRFLHPDQLETIGFPKDLIPHHATRADWAFFSYCPLSPTLAFVASPLLTPPGASLYRQTRDPRLILMLNDLERQSCEEVLVSPLANPFGPLAPLVREIDALGERLIATTSRCAISITSQTDRFLIPCSTIAFEDGPTPLEPRIRFRTPDASQLKALPVGTVLREVQAFQSDGPSGGMRGARLVTAGSSPDEDWVIEGDVRLAV